MGLNLNDKITIMIGEALSTDDQNVLSILYQPIIGSRCYGIYMSLYSLLNRSNNRFTVENCNIIDLFGINSESFEADRKKLEAIGLMNTYSKNDEFVYLLKAPLSARQFFHDGLMGNYLFDRVGEKLFNCIVKLFQVEKFNRDGYTNITESFDNVFKNKASEITIDGDGYFIDKKQNRSAKIENIDFDYDVFLKDLSLSVLEKQNLSKDFEEVIIKTAYCYDLSESEMQQIYYRSLVDGNISYVKLTKEAKILSKYKKQTKSSDNLNGVDLFKTAKPEDILKTLVEKDKIKRENFSDIAKVVEESPYDLEITNLVIFYAITKFKEKGTCPPYGYFIKVIDSFMQYKVKTFDEAKDFILRQADYVAPVVEKKEVETSSWAEDFRKKHGEEL